jgi:hypothetical protein
MMSGLSAFARAISVERSAAVSGYGIISTISKPGLSAFVLDLLLPLPHRLRDVGGDRVDAGDVDHVRYPALLGQRRDRRDVGGVEAAGEDLRPGPDQPVRLRARDLHLRLAVGEQQLQPRAPHRLDPAGGVDGVGGELGTQSTVAAHLGHRTRDRADDADLDGLGLGPQRPRHGGGSGSDGGDVEEAAATDGRSRHGRRGPR